MASASGCGCRHLLNDASAFRASAFFHSFVHISGKRSDFRKNFITHVSLEKEIPLKYGSHWTRDQNQIRLGRSRRFLCAPEQRRRQENSLWGQALSWGPTLPPPLHQPSPTRLSPPPFPSPPFPCLTLSSRTLSLRSRPNKIQLERSGVSP